MKTIISECQSAFLQGGNIIDRVVIINELIYYAKKKGEPCMLLKVDFEKVYDSMCWEYLDYMFDRIGFSGRWRAWIRECLASASVSVLVNVSPTKEFAMIKGLRQGDPMAPFLFLIAAEGLIGLIRNAINLGVYEQYIIRSNEEEVAVSHTHYADDTIMASRLSLNNVFVMKCILRCSN